MSAPDRECLRYRDVLDWLTARGPGEPGMSVYAVRLMIQDGTIIGKPLRPGGQNYYSRTQIQTDVLDKLNPPTTTTAGKVPAAPAGGTTT